MERVVVCAESMKGRHHAAIGVRLQGKIRVTRRTTRSLCGVPVKATAREFVIDNSTQGCSYCNKLAKGDQ
jgi:hypothetical protein